MWWGDGRLCLCLYCGAQSTFHGKAASATEQVRFVIQSILIKAHSWKWTLNTLGVVSSGELCMAYLLKLKQSTKCLCSPKKEAAHITVFGKGLGAIPDYSWPEAIQSYPLSVPVFSHPSCQLILNAFSQVCVLITARWIIMLHFGAADSFGFEYKGDVNEDSLCALDH